MPSRLWHTAAPLPLASTAQDSASVLQALHDAGAHKPDSRIGLFRLLPLLLALFAIVACVPTSQAEVDLPAGLMRGEVTFPDLRPLPADATVEVQIIDTSVAGYPANVFASTIIQASGLRPPLPFQLVYDPAKVKPNVSYLIGARVLSGGELLYVSQAGQTVLADGDSRNNIEIAASVLPAQAAVPGQLNGVLTWLTRDLLPENATVAVQLVDRTTQPYARIAEDSFRSGGAQTPIPFLLTFDPQSIDPARTYAIEARISVDGRLAWLTEDPVPALTQDAASDNLEVPLQRVASETAATAGNTVVANLVFPAGDVLPSGSQVIVEITDLAQNAIVASTEMRGEGLQSPLFVEIPLDFTPSELRQFVLRARIVGPNAMLYIDEAELPVLTQGAPVTNIAVPLIALTAPVAFATSSATPIAVPTAVAIVGDAPAPVIAPAFPGGGSGEDAAAGEEAADETEIEALDLSGILFGTVTVSVQPDDAEIGAGTLNEILVLLAMLIDDEPVVLGQVTLDAFGLDEAQGFEVAYEPSLIDPTLDYITFAQMLDLDGNVIAESAPVTVLTHDNPQDDVELSLLVELEVASAVEAPEPEPTPDAEVTATPEADDAAAQAGDGATVVGTVGYNERIALPAGSVVQVQLLNLATTPFSVVAEDRIVTTGEQPPFDFVLPLTNVNSDGLRTYAVAASISAEGETLWSAPGLTPLLIAGTPRTEVNLTLQSGENGGSAMPNVGDATSTDGLGGAVVAAAPATTPTVATSLADLGDDIVGVIVRFGSATSQSAGTEVRVEVRNVTVSTILAEATADASNRAEPVFVRLPYAAADVISANEYRVFVTVLQDGAPVGFTGRGSPVLTNGAPNAVEITLP